MRIQVLAEDGISAQARTYAEYRLFAALSQLVDTEQVRDARVILRPAKQRRGCEGVSCTMTVALNPGGILRIRTTGDHAYAAINRAVERLRSASMAAFDADAAAEKAFSNGPRVHYCPIPCPSPCYLWCQVFGSPKGHRRRPKDAVVTNRR
jgi:ribosome-associated translation inhibitor RaiA